MGHRTLRTFQEQPEGRTSPLTPALSSIQMVSNSQCVGRPAGCPLGWGSPAYLGAHLTALGPLQSPTRTAPPETSTCRFLSSAVSPRARHAPCCAIQLCVLSQQNVIPVRDARPHGREGTRRPRRHHRDWLLHELYQENLYKQTKSQIPIHTLQLTKYKINVLARYSTSGRALPSPLSLFPRRPLLCWGSGPPPLRLQLQKSYVPFRRGLTAAPPSARTHTAS